MSVGILPVCVHGLCPWMSEEDTVAPGTGVLDGWL